MGAFACAVARAVRFGCWQRLCHFFMVKMGRSPRIMCVSSYRFDSNFLFLLRMLYLPSRHLCGHRIAYPAAQGQQGDQKGEQQMAHG